MQWDGEVEQGAGEEEREKGSQDVYYFSVLVVVVLCSILYEWEPNYHRASVAKAAARCKPPAKITVCVHDDHLSCE